MSTTLQPRTYIHWTGPRQWALMEMLEDGMNDREIGEQLGKHTYTITTARRRYGIRSCSEIHHSALGMAKVIGIDHNKVIRWINNGYIHARRDEATLHAPWVISDEALITFLEDERYWHLWEPELVDERYHEYVQRRAQVRFLTIDEAAERCLVVPGTVRRWLWKGLLPGRHYGCKGSRILESDLEKFVQPAHKQRIFRRPLRRFTAQEDSILVDMRDRGETWAAIGAVIDRDPAVVQQRWKRLQERGS